VLVPSNLTISHGSGNQHSSFVESLVRGGINKPNQEVLDTIVKRFSNPFQAAVLCGSIDTCVNLYRTVKELPTSFTRGVIQNDLNLSINGPMSLAQPNILIAFDLCNGNQLFIKLLRMPQTLITYAKSSKEGVVIARNQCLCHTSRGKHHWFGSM
jgi:hypothetical protein